MTNPNTQPIAEQSPVTQQPISDAEYEQLRQQVVKEYDSPFYGGIGHVAVEPPERTAVYEPIGPWIGM